VHDDCVIAFDLFGVVPARLLTAILHNLEAQQLELLCSVGEEHSLRVVAEALGHKEQLVAPMLQLALEFRPVVDFLQTEQVGIMFPYDLQLSSTPCLPSV